MKLKKDMHEIELKPCPFCNGKSIFAPLSTCRGYIACIGECGFRSGDEWDAPMTHPAKERDKWYTILAQKWNRRAKYEN